MHCHLERIKRYITVHDICVNVPQCICACLCILPVKGSAPPEGTVTVDSDPGIYRPAPAQSNTKISHNVQQHFVSC